MFLIGPVGVMDSFLYLGELLLKTLKLHNRGYAVAPAYIATKILYLITNMNATEFLRNLKKSSFPSSSLSSAFWAPIAT